MNLKGVINIIRGIVKLRGGTDNAIIGNVGDSLKVSVSAPITISGLVPAGTEDGDPLSPAFYWVNNERVQIQSTEDKDSVITYDDAGTKFQRPVRIDATSAHFPGVTVRTDITYASPGTKFQRPSQVTRSII